MLGRQSPADIILDDATLSRQHARLEATPEGAVLVDLGSKNGISTQGSRVSSLVVYPGLHFELGKLHALALEAGGMPPPGAPVFLDGVIDAELVRARYFRRPLTVALMQGAPKDLAALGQHLRPVDIVATYAPGVMAVCLPELSVHDAQAVLQPAALSMRCGLAAFPQDGTSRDALLGNALHQLQRASTGSLQFSSPATLQSADIDVEDGIIHGAGAFGALLEQVDRCAAAPFPVLLHGDSGTGKELLARRIHQRSGLKGALRAINCGAIPASLIEATLFGHVRGAFTGAVSDQAGVFEAADGGTLFLDEIGELAPPAQAALLRVLEEKKLQRVGSNRDVTVDVRVVAATHADLAARAEAGTFRSDLYHRLSTLSLTVPPLRDRPEDIPPLAQHFAREAALQMKRSSVTFDQDAMAAMIAYRWPGNVRELRNVVNRALVFGAGDVIGIADLPAWADGLGLQRSHASEGSRAGQSESLSDAVARVERTRIQEALAATDGNQTEAAALLGLPRRTLAHKVARYGLRGKGAPEDEA